MDPWLTTAIVMLACMIPCGVVALRGSLPDRLVGLETGGAFAVLVLLLLSEAFGRAPFLDLALALALLAFGGGLVFARFIERWM